MNTMLDELTPTMRRVADAFNDVERELTGRVLSLAAAHPKRRGELRAEYTRRILRLAREGK